MKAGIDLKITVTNEAAKWYKEEMALSDGDYLQFVVRLYGQSIHPNYSLGIEKSDPLHISIQTEVEGIIFYFEKEDDWFIKDYHLTVSLDGDEPAFHFEPMA